jgi:hypothetical protein
VPFADDGSDVHILQEARFWPGTLLVCDALPMSSGAVALRFPKPLEEKSASAAHARPTKKTADAFLSDFPWLADYVSDARASSSGGA